MHEKSWYFVDFNQCQGHTQSRTSKAPKGFENFGKIEFFTENVKKLADIELRFYSRILRYSNVKLQFDNLDSFEV